MGPGLRGVYDSDFYERPSLLTEGFPDTAPPTARDMLPAGTRRWRDPWEGTFLGRGYDNYHNRPEGAIELVGDDEPFTWGDGEGGPNMYPAEMVDDEFIAARNGDPGWSPAYIPGGWRQDQLHFR